MTLPMEVWAAPGRWNESLLIVDTADLPFPVHLVFLVTHLSCMCMLVQARYCPDKRARARLAIKAGIGAQKPDWSVTESPHDTSATSN